MKAQLVTKIAPEVLDYARDVVYWTPGATLSGLVEEALRREAKRREKGNGGKAFPSRNGRVLQGGRPLKS